MKWKNFKSHFRFNKQERSGIFFLLLTIVLLQLGYFLWTAFSSDGNRDILKEDVEMQARIDALRKKAQRKDSDTIYPFNPNFITDYKGYALGMSVDEIDRLHRFRQADKFVNSAMEFQKVTQVSDSLLEAISPYFRFPEWTQKTKRSAADSGPHDVKQSNFPIPEGPGKNFLDLNSASAEDLRSIRGIGEKLSARIIKFRDRLGGFLVDEQIYHVYGLEPEVAQKVLRRFKVLGKPKVDVLRVNEVSVDELVKLVYINYDLASKIINYRDTNGRIVTFNELATIEGFPSEKLDIIQLYLSLD